jgi:FkbM family methyltransferase
VLPAVVFPQTLSSYFEKLLIHSKFYPGLRELRRDVVFDSLTTKDIRDNEKIMLLYSFLLTDASNCIDVGSHYGKYLEAFSRLAPLGRHLAIEPLPDYAENLRTNFPSVSVYELALGASNGLVDFHRVVNLEGWSGLKLSNYPGQYQTEILKVKLSTLDDFLPADYKLDLLKIDVEGAELDVLRGAVNTLTKHRPYIVFEHFVDAYRPYGISPVDIFSFLCIKLDYRIFSIDGLGPLSEVEFTRLADSRICWNFVAHH